MFRFISLFLILIFLISGAETAIGQVGVPPGLQTASKGLVVNGLNVSPTYLPCVINGSTTAPIPASCNNKRISVTSTTGIPLTIGDAGSAGYEAGTVFLIVNDGTGGIAGPASITTPTTTICTGSGLLSVTIPSQGSALELDSNGSTWDCIWYAGPGGGSAVVANSTSTTTGGLISNGRSDATLAGPNAVMGTFKTTGPNSIGTARDWFTIKTVGTVTTSGASEATETSFLTNQGGSQVTVASMSTAGFNAKTGVTVGSANLPAVTINRDYIARHVICSTGTTPTVTAGGSGAGGATPVLENRGQDCSGYINVLTSGVPSASAIIAKLTYGTVPTHPSPCTLTAANAATALASASWYVDVDPTDPNSTYMTITSTTTPLTTGITYRWAYSCPGFK